MIVPNLLSFSFWPSASYNSMSGATINLTVNFNKVKEKDAQNSNFEIPWDTELRKNSRPFTFLDWHSRITHNIYGRTQELSDLHDWAKDDKSVRLKFITGEGGTGKSRLAAQYAEDLKSKGWNAGFLRYSYGETTIAMPKAGTLIIIDYPEENLLFVEKLLTRIKEQKCQGKLRLLLLSRKTVDDWDSHILSWRIDNMADTVPVHLDTLDPYVAYKLYEGALSKYADIRETKPKKCTADEMDSWIKRDNENKRPLYILALALYSAYNPTENPLSLNSSKIISALVERECSRLEKESLSIWDNQKRGSLKIFASLATIAGGLSLDKLDEIRKEETLAGLLPDGVEFLNDIKKSAIVRGNLIPPLKPDIMAAALVTKVLSGYKHYAKELVWLGLISNFDDVLDRFSRMCHDAGLTINSNTGLLEDWLYEGVVNNSERCEKIHDIFTEPPIPQSCLKVAIYVCRTLAENADSDAEKALYCNNLSTHLQEIGDSDGALKVSRESVAILRRLASENPSRHNPELATSLNNLSNRLDENMNPVDALSAIKEAVAIYRLLVAENSVSYNSALAIILTNLSLRLDTEGDSDGALKASKEAVAICRSLEKERPTYKLDFANCLSNLSNSLNTSNDYKGALIASKEALVIYRRLAEENPARYNSFLARSLGHNGRMLWNTKDTTGAEAAFKEGIELIRPLAEQWPGSRHDSLLQTLEKDLARIREASEEG